MSTSEELSKKVREGSFWGTTVSILGLVLASLGGFFLDVMLEFAGIVLGAAGYGLGAHKLGIATVAISTILLLAFLAAGQSEIPGMEPRGPMAGGQ